MTTAIRERSPAQRLTGLQKKSEALTHEANTLQVDLARLRDTKKTLLEETARDNPGILSRLWQPGNPGAQIEKQIKQKEGRLAHVEEERAALAPAIAEAQAEHVEERMAEYRARQAEIHERELAALDSAFDSFNDLVSKFHDGYAPIVTEARQLFGKAQSEGMNIAKPAITPPGNFEIFLANSLAAAFRGGNATVDRIYTEKVERRSGLGVPNPYKPRAESS